MSKTIEIKALPYSDRIIDYGLQGLSLIKNDSLTVDIQENITHDDKGITKNIGFHYRHKGKEIKGRYLRVTVINDKVGWTISKRRPKMHTPKNLKLADNYIETRI